MRDTPALLTHPISYIQPQTSRLLTLPPELRLQILGLILPQDDFNTRSNYSHRILPSVLARVYRQLRNEALPIHYEAATFRMNCHRIGFDKDNV